MIASSSMLEPVSSSTFAGSRSLCSDAHPHAPSKRLPVPEHTGSKFGNERSSNSCPGQLDRKVLRSDERVPDMDQPGVLPREAFAEEVDPACTLLIQPKSMGKLAQVRDDRELAHDDDSTIPRAEAT